MGSTPATHNTTAEIVNEIIQISIMEIGVNAAIAAATAELPFLGFPVIKQLFSMAVKWLGSRIYTALAHLATFQIIDLQTDSEVREYNDAVLRLKEALSKEGSDVSSAKNEFRDRLARLIRWDGSATA